MSSSTSRSMRVRGEEEEEDFFKKRGKEGSSTMRA